MAPHSVAMMITVAFGHFVGQSPRSPTPLVTTGLI